MPGENTGWILANVLNENLGVSSRGKMAKSLDKFLDDLRLP